MFSAEISTRPDAEGDKRLDKLESFLDKLHSKGNILWLISQIFLSIKRSNLSSIEVSDVCVNMPAGVSSKPSTIEVTEEKEKEVMTLDDDETFQRFFKSMSPTTLSANLLLDEEEDFSALQFDSPK